MTGLTMTATVDGVGTELKSAAFPAVSVIVPVMLVGSTVIPSTS